jgi:hypothetical protein
MIGTTAEASETQLENRLPLVLPTRVITYAWGEKYVGELLSLTLPALLAPGNLPHVAATVPCEVVILTQQRFFTRFLADAAVVRMQEYCRVRLLALDDLISDPDKYGMALTHILHRGFADLGPAVTDRWLMFLNADFILADGSLRNLLNRLAAGERLVASPSYCVNAGAAVPELLHRIDPHTRGLSLPPREMAALVLCHRHNTIRGKTVNQSLFSIRLLDQFYWQIDGDTLLGHQMPIAIVGMRPERYLAEPNSYWDHGLMREFVPDAAHSVIGDSDEFLMLELRGEEVAQDQLRLGWPAPAEIARNAISFLTAYQRDMAQYPLTLHAQDLPPDVDQARSRLRAFVDSVLAHLPPVLPSHLDHPQWNYHRPGFIKSRHDYLSKQFGSATETSEPPPDLGELDRIWWKLDGLSKSYERRRGQLIELRDHLRSAVVAVEDRLQARITRERENLADVLGDMPTQRSDESSGLDLERILHACGEYPQNEMPAGSEAPWVARLNEAAAAWMAIDKDVKERRETIAKALEWIDTHYENRLAMVDLEFQLASGSLQAEYHRLTTQRIISAAIPFVTVRHSSQAVIPVTSGGSLKRIVKRVYRRFYGAPPRVTRLHPYWAPLRHLVRVVDLAAREGAANTLVIIGRGGIADTVADGLPGLHAKVSLAEALQGNLAAALSRSREIDLCICTLDDLEIVQFSEIVKALAPCLREGGRIIGFYPNMDLDLLSVDNPKLLHGLSDLPGSARIYYAGSPQSAQVLQSFRKALSAPSMGRVINVPRFATALLRLTPRALIANRLEDMIPEDQLSLLPDPCTSLTLEVSL